MLGTGPQTRRRERWHVVGEPGEPEYQGDWGPSPANLGFRFRKVGTAVFLEGTVVNGDYDETVAPLFYLPEEFWPETADWYSIILGGNAAGPKTCYMGIYGAPYEDVLPDDVGLVYARVLGTYGPVTDLAGAVMWWTNE